MLRGLRGPRGQSQRVVEGSEKRHHCDEHAVHHGSERRRLVPREHCMLLNITRLLITGVSVSLSLRVCLSLPRWHLPDLPACLIIQLPTYIRYDSIIHVSSSVSEGCCVIFLHMSLSSANLLSPSYLFFCIHCITSSVHILLGRPLIYFPSNFPFRTSKTLRPLDPLIQHMPISVS